MSNKSIDSNKDTSIKINDIDLLKKNNDDLFNLNSLNKEDFLLKNKLDSTSTNPLIITKNEEETNQPMTRSNDEIKQLETGHKSRYSNSPRHRSHSSISKHESIDQNDNQKLSRKDAKKYNKKTSNN